MAAVPEILVTGYKAIASNYTMGGLDWVSGKFLYRTGSSVLV